MCRGGTEQCAAAHSAETSCGRDCSRRVGRGKGGPGRPRRLARSRGAPLIRYAGLTLSRAIESVTKDWHPCALSSATRYTSQARLAAHHSSCGRGRSLCHTAHTHGRTARAHKTNSTHPVDAQFRLSGGDSPTMRDEMPMPPRPARIACRSCRTCACHACTTADDRASFTAKRRQRPKRRSRRRGRSRASQTPSPAPSEGL